MEMAPLKVVCLVDSAGDEDEIGEGICTLMVCGVSNVVEDRTCKNGWVAVLCACERKGKIS